jgi:hypothetical protein
VSPDISLQQASSRRYPSPSIPTCKRHPLALSSPTIHLRSGIPGPRAIRQSTTLSRLPHPRPVKSIRLVCGYESRPAVGRRSGPFCVQLSFHARDGCRPRRASHHNLGHAPSHPDHADLEPGACLNLEEYFLRDLPRTSLPSSTNPNLPRLRTCHAHSAANPPPPPPRPRPIPACPHPSQLPTPSNLSDLRVRPPPSLPPPSVTTDLRPTRPACHTGQSGHAGLSTNSRPAGVVDQVAKQSRSSRTLLTSPGFPSPCRQYGRRGSAGRDRDAARPARQYRAAGADDTRVACCPFSLFCFSCVADCCEPHEPWPKIRTQPCRRTSSRASMDAADTVDRFALALVWPRPQQSTSKSDKPSVIAPPKDGALHYTVAHSRATRALEVRRSSRFRDSAAHGRPYSRRVPDLPDSTSTTV